MAAMGRFAGNQQTDRNGRRPLPDSRREGLDATALEYTAVPLDDALTDLRALEQKLRVELQKDKERMNMASHTTESKPSGSNVPESYGLSLVAESELMLPSSHPETSSDTADMVVHLMTLCPQQTVQAARQGLPGPKARRSSGQELETGIRVR